MSVAVSALTFIHVVISVVAIASGFVVMFGLITGKFFNSLTKLFLGTTILTSVTGFLFPVHKFMPSQVLGILSLITLAFATYALYSRELVGAWRRTYVIAAVISLYLNVFVLIAQMFMKVPALRALAPTQSEPPFKIAQLVVLLTFILFGFLATKSFTAERVRLA
jgi:hypothetical protein